jgi:NADH:ubiquinone oxidoreductase subunit F (NADH-binding)
VFGVRPRLSSETMLGELERSGLLGRGGAGFPAVLKWRAAAEHARRDDGAVVVADAVESEPASFKDRTLLALRPHLVLDGLQLAAEGVGATRAIMYISRSNDTLVRTVTAAARERSRGPDPGLPVQVVTSPSRYVAGEETAVVNRLNGRAARPNAVPPRPYERGIGGLPTLLHNVETLAHVALIARFGAGWFRSAGSPASPGTTLVTVSGAVRTPGVHEVDYNETVDDIVERAGGVISEPAAVLLGGYFGRWVDAAVAWPVSIEGPALRRIQAGLGAGVIAVLPRGVCGVAESDRVLSFLARESAGQCGPCQFGLPAMAETLHAVAEGRARPQALEQLTRWAGEIRGRGACRHPDGAALFVTSALRVFGDDLRRHVRDGPCPAARRAPILPTPVLPSGWR